ncbi:YppG family protein [Lederbergia citrea]|uniref:YppG family protein n=1 Tax=Lederbergia citrea TaxID=2833581 RepID=UPI001BC92DC5|nr:YppG family protein [Lederbergia citrea]MBS4176600.1 YppG family protein [Lederbergia citrea]
MLNRYRNIRLPSGLPYQSQYQHQMPPAHYPYAMQPYQFGGMPSYPMPPMPHFPPPYPNGMQQYHPYLEQGPMQNGGEKQGSHLFHNPLQPDDGYMYEKFGNQLGYPNAYPKPPNVPKTVGNNFGSVLNSFKSQNGSLDFNKMINTTGQLVNAVNQVSGMFKGLGGLFKG